MYCWNCRDLIETQRVALDLKECVNRSDLVRFSKLRPGNLQMSRFNNPPFFRNGGDP